ncbi:restriction endonuclease subunit S [Mycoplasma sp. 3118]
MQKQKLAPEIRFKGFEEEWNQKVINQTLIPVISTLTMSNVQGKGEILLFDANSIVGYSSYALSSVPYLTIIKDGAGVGRIRKLPGNSAFLGTMTGLIPRNVDIDFIHSLISTLSLEKSFSGSTIPHIYFSDYGKLKIYIPYFSEQQKIGQFFSSIDSLIQSQELKLKKLNEIKQSLLSKMFASENQKFPEIRFKGFDDEWVKFKLGDIGIFNSNGVDKVFREKDNAVHMVNYMDVYNKVEITLNNINRFMITTANNSELIKNNLIKGDILFTPSSETIDDIGHTFVVQETIPNLVYSYHLVRFRPNSEEFYETFANYCLDQKRLCEQYMLRAQGVQRFVLNREHFNSLSVIKPSILEQKK